MDPYKVTNINMPAPPNRHSTARLGTELRVDQLLELLHIIVLLFDIEFVVENLRLLLLLFLHLLLAIKFLGGRLWGSFGRDVLVKKFGEGVALLLLKLVS